TLEDREARLRLLLDGTRPEEIAQAEARLRAAEATLQQMRNGYREEEIGEARARRDAAAAAVDAIRRQLAELNVVSPADGIVDAVDLWPGDLVAPNAPVVTLLLPEELRIRAYVPERLLQVRVGDPVAVTVASLPGRRFRGRIEFVAREAEFTPHNVQTPEDRAQLAYRIRVRLLEGHRFIRPGMIVDIHFDAGMGFDQGGGDVRGGDRATEAGSGSGSGRSRGAHQ
ncbi:MAG: HlyD family efflux transporter periplasmic adaptor subunit, partial [Planctomycetota bacterium]